LNYKKVLIAKYFPKDHCYADERDILVFASENDKRPKWIKNDEEFFVSLKDRTPSLFGWVTELSKPLNLEAFIKEDFQGRINKSMINIAELDLLMYKHFFESINKYSVGSTIAASWSEYGILKKKRELKFHKVFLY
jgi:hypothetical protein